MVFRRESKAGDAFQRQINALRQQLGGSSYRAEDEELAAEQQIDTMETVDEGYPAARPEFEEGFAAYPHGDYGFEQAEPEIGLPAAPDEPIVPAIPAVDAQTTVISNNAIWKGDITSEGSMHILGRFEGNINARDEVFILEEAQVEAAIAAAKVIISGRYHGTMNCGDRLEVLPTGRVKGEVFAPTLVVHNGAIINGNVKMTASAKPAGEAPSPAAVHRRSARGPA
jgi:cytoskeletal protein CcmA (bactofilin family)